MPNEQTSVPLFTAGEVLTAANMNLSAGTGVPVFSNSTTRDAGFGGAGEKVLAEGQLCYLSSTNVVQQYNGSSWETVGPATAGALVRVGGGSLSTTTTTFDNVFTSTYKSYAIVFSSCAISSNTSATLQLRYAGPTSQTTSYYSGQFSTSYLGATASGGVNNGSAWNIVSATTDGFSGIVTISGIDNVVRTTFQSVMNSTSVNGLYIAGGDNTTIRTYTGFTIASSGTLSGTVNIYGYSLS